MTALRALVLQYLPRKCMCIYMKWIERGWRDTEHNVNGLGMESEGEIQGQRSLVAL